LKKAFFISFIFHAALFAADFGFKYSSINQESPVPKVSVRGLSVDLLTDNKVASTEVSLKSVKKQVKDKNKDALKKAVKSPRRDKNKYLRSLPIKASLPLTGKEYKKWLLYYYSGILKKIKERMEETGLSLGWVSISFKIKRSGRVVLSKVISSSYSLSVENRISDFAKKCSFSPFPEKIKDKMIYILVKVIYK
jgi:outer membrane biosynthesis protein TonB